MAKLRIHFGMKIVALLLVMVFSSAVLSGAAESTSSDAKTESDNDTVTVESECKTTLSYRYLKGTKYKNLIATRYTNLIKTAMPKSTPEQVDVEENGAPASYSATPSAAGSYGTNPATPTATSAYYGEVSPVAYVSLSGTRLQNYPIYQDTNSYSFSSSAYNYHELAWISKNARISGGNISNNIILFGHNWGNCFYPFKSGGAQFEPLMDFFNTGFASSNNIVSLTTADGSSYTYSVFAVFFTRDLNFYIKPNGNPSSVAAKAISYADSYGLYSAPYGGGKLITFSTCTRYLGNDASQRFVVMAEMIG